MATNTGRDYRQGPVKERVQIQNPITGRWVKIDTSTGKILEIKKTSGPFKGVAKSGSKVPTSKE